MYNNNEMNIIVTQWQLIILYSSDRNDTPKHLKMTRNRLTYFDVPILLICPWTADLTVPHFYLTYQDLHLAALIVAVRKHKENETENEL